MKSRSRWPAIVVAAGILASPFAIAAPAYAIGSFNVKLTAAGCTEGDYYGQSARVNVSGIWGIRATTKYTYPVCFSNVVGARPFGPTSSGPWQYNNQTVVTTLTLGTTYPASGAGWHNVNGAHMRTA